MMPVPETNSQVVQVVGRGQRLRGIHVGRRVGIRAAERDRHLACAIGIGDVFHLAGDLALTANVFLTELGGQGRDALRVKPLEGAPRGSGDDGANEYYSDDHGERED